MYFCVRNGQSTGISYPGCRSSSWFGANLCFLTIFLWCCWVSFCPPLGYSLKPLDRELGGFRPLSSSNNHPLGKFKLSTTKRAVIVQASYRYITLYLVPPLTFDCRDPPWNCFTGKVIAEDDLTQTLEYDFTVNMLTMEMVKPHGNNFSRVSMSGRMLHTPSISILTYWSMFCASLFTSVMVVEGQALQVPLLVDLF